MTNTHCERCLVCNVIQCDFVRSFQSDEKHMPKKKKRSLLLLAIALLLHIPHVLHTFIMPNEFLLTSGIYAERDFRKGLSNFILFILFAPNTTEHSIKHSLCVQPAANQKNTPLFVSTVLFVSIMFSTCYYWHAYSFLNDQRAHILFNNVRHLVAKVAPKSYLYRVKVWL